LDGIRVEELSASDAINGAADQTIFQTAELRLDETRKAIEEAIEEHRPSRLVYDSLLEIRLITGDTPRFRRELIAFKAFLAHATSSLCSSIQRFATPRMPARRSKVSLMA
jgi:circadian clock protein KaiC